MKRSTGINIGSSSILVIFIILCLTTFATLSMVSAGADLRLTEKAANATMEYYAADAKAEETLSSIDGMLREMKTVSQNPQAYASAVIGGLPAVVQDAMIDQSADAVTVSYAVPINENQQLAVTLQIPADPKGNSLYRRMVWQTVNTGEWQPAQEGLDLWGGEGEMMLFDGENMPFETP